MIATGSLELARAWYEALRDKTDTSRAMNGAGQTSDWAAKQRAKARCAAQLPGLLIPLAMDFNFNGRSLHLPRELVDHICGFLEYPSEPSYLFSARLVNRSFYEAATSLITHTWDCPSELFVPPAAHLGWPSRFMGTILDKNKASWVPNPVTLWTWLRIPTSVTLEDNESEVGIRFVEALIAPAELEEGPYDYRLIDKQAYARKAISWGRMDEDPEVFSIVTQWSSPQVLSLYRYYEEAEELQAFLEEVAPGCIASSTSQYLPIAATEKNKRPLFNGHCEIRTVYFGASTQEQRQKFERDIEQCKAESQNESTWTGYSSFWWVSGLCQFKGNTAIAAQFVFYGNAEKTIATHQETRKQTLRLHETDGLFEEHIRAAGALGMKSSHFNFRSGPWRN